MKKIPVVVLTSSENPDHEGRSMDLGARAFHKKPPDLDSLDQVVRTIVEEWLDTEVNVPLQSAG